MSKEYIDKAILYRKISELEEIARTRYLDTPSNSPAHERYMAQLNERTSFKHLVADFSNADVSEVVHGEWLENDGRCYCNRCFEFSCTVMDDTGTIYNDLTKFCPNCGAKMDGGKES